MHSYNNYCDLYGISDITNSLLIKLNIINKNIVINIISWVLTVLLESFPR